MAPTVGHDHEMASTSLKDNPKHRRSLNNSNKASTEHVENSDAMIEDGASTTDSDGTTIHYTKYPNRWSRVRYASLPSSHALPPSLSLSPSPPPCPSYPSCPPTSRSLTPSSQGGSPRACSRVLWHHDPHYLRQWCRLSNGTVHEHQSLGVPERSKASLIHLARLPCTHTSAARTTCL